MIGPIKAIILSSCCNIESKSSNTPCTTPYTMHHAMHGPACPSPYSQSDPPPLTEGHKDYTILLLHLVSKYYVFIDLRIFFINLNLKTVCLVGTLTLTLQKINNLQIRNSFHHLVFRT